MPALLDLLPQDNIHVHKAASTHGGEYVGPCPLCGGVDRFHVWPEEGDGGKYWCRGCEKGGDIIQYLREIRKLSYLDACKEAGIKPAPMKRSFDWGKSANSEHIRKWSPREITQPPEEWIKKCSAFVDWAYGQLLDNASMRSYLRFKRGMSEESVRAHRIGWNPSGLNRGRDFWGLPEKLKPDGTKQTIWLPQGIVIPYFVDGILQRARIRRLDRNGNTPEKGPAYAIVSGSTSAAMIPEKSSQVLVVVESEFDAILLDQEAGHLCGVVAIGSASARPDKRVFEILQASDLILVALDSDDQREDGQNPGAKEAQWWLSHFSQARRLPPVDGKDPGEMWKNGIDLQQWVAIGVNKYFPQSHTQKHRQAGEFLDTATPIQGPINQPLDNQSIPFETLNAIASPRYNQIAEAYPNGCSEWLSQCRPDLAGEERADFDWLDEVWRLCMVGRSAIQDFKTALDIWFDGWMEAIQIFKEAQI